MEHKHLTINDKYILERKFSNRKLNYRKEYKDLKQCSQKTDVILNSNEPRKGSLRGFGCLIFSLILIAVLVVAAIKNPSSTETKEIIKTVLIEKTNEKLSEEITEEGNDGFNKFIAFAGMTIMPHMIDCFVSIKVSDYIIFSTFDCTTKDKEEPKTLVSGVILFGKIIPLNSDLKEDTLNFN